MKPTDPFYLNQPEKAFVALNGATVGVGLVTRGYRGYSPIYDYTPDPEKYAPESYQEARESALECAQKCVDTYNKSIGVSPAQAEAALIGSMAGWDAPGANPLVWEERMASP